MNTMHVAMELVRLNREGQTDTLFDTLYAEDAVSVEVAAMPGMDRTVQGIAAIKAKSQWWFENHDVHAFEIRGPWPHDDRFIVGYAIDVTHRPSGERMQMEEAALYTVKDGKVVREEFFYPTGP